MWVDRCGPERRGAPSSQLSDEAAGLPGLESAPVMSKPGSVPREVRSAPSDAHTVESASTEGVVLGGDRTQSSSIFVVMLANVPEDFASSLPWALLALAIRLLQP